MSAERRPSAQPSTLRRAARWTLAKVPEDRRPAAKALARSARSLALGTPLPDLSPGASAPATSERAAKGQGTATHRQWIRTRPPSPDGPAPAVPHLDDPAEAAAVRAGWQLVNAYETLTVNGAARVFYDDLKAWDRYAEESLPSAARREGIQYSAANWLRFRRMADFVRDGDRVFDVGTGKGELAGVLMTVRDIEYRGIELEPSILERFRSWQQEEYPDRALAVENKSLYDLTPEYVADGGTTMVMCCEVLEHVPDAEEALAVLARTLPEGADLLFSVPLHGRLENVWGHVSVFDTYRLHEMVERAGLFVHHVEPLANVWTLVVANRTPARSTRVAGSGHRPEVLAERPLTRHRPFLPVPRDRVRLVGGGDATMTDDERTTASRITFTRNVTVEVPVESLEALRFRLNPVDEPATRLRSVTVEARAGSDYLGRWVWTPRPGSLVRHQFRRVALRPGETGRGLKVNGFTTVDGADRVLVTVRCDHRDPVTILLEFGLLP